LGPEKEQHRALAELQESRHATDAWEELVAPWLAGHPEGGIGTSEILERALKVEPGLQDKAKQTRVGDIMSRLGWRRRRIGGRGDRRYLYFSPGDDEEQP